MPYSEHFSKKHDGSYRGPDRRNSMADFPDFDIRPSLLVIALIGALSAAINVYSQGFLYKTLQRETLFVLSIIALAVAGMLSIIRWRLDGMARSFWYGLASIVGMVPLLGIGANERTSLSLLLGTVAATAVLSIWALRSPAVDVAPNYRWRLLAATAAGLTGLMVGASERGPRHEYTFAVVGLSVLLLGAVSYRRYNAESSINGMWFVPTLFAIGIAPLVALSEGVDVLGSEYGGVMRFAAAGVAIAGSSLELHFAASREKFDAITHAAELRDQVETLQNSEAASMAQIHEVRSRVLSIEGGVAVASVGDESELTRAIRDEIERLRNLVAAPTPPSYGPFQILESLRSTLLVAASSLPVVFDIDEDLVAVGSPEDLAQVVHGLVSNASKYAPGSPIEVSATRDADYILVLVEDRGPGVARGKRDLIFERGWRASLEDAEGYGLGLAIGRELITKAGGDLWVTPRTGGGAKFVVSLPRWQGLTSIDASVTHGATTDLSYNAPERANTAALKEEERREGIKRLGGAT
ncbi:signal transduction histidine kinase [Actinobacteria bacterium IMCC26256]|nr:signal transduction histidine kinase [Actinobacteria bacterium IMCC26256]